MSYQHKFKNTYLWGSYSPINGDSFVWEINGVNQKIFQAYLTSFSEYKANELKIIVLDNAGFHSLKNLIIPANIKLINIPPYSPVLNPCERMWHYIKAKFKNEMMSDMEQLRNWLHTQVNAISPKQVKSIVHHSLFTKAFYASI